MHNGTDEVATKQHLLGCQTNILSSYSLKEQMEEAALAYSDLLEGKDKPVVGSTCKYDAGTFGMTRCPQFLSYVCVCPGPPAAVHRKL